MLPVRATSCVYTCRWTGGHVAWDWGGLRRLAQGWCQVIVLILLLLSMGDSCINNPQLSLYRYVALSLCRDYSILRRMWSRGHQRHTFYLFFRFNYGGGLILEGWIDNRVEIFSFHIDDLWHDVLSLRRFRWILDDDFRFHRFHESNSAMDIVRRNSGKG